MADLGLASSISFAEQRTSSMTDKCQIPRLDARFGLLSLRMKRLLRGDWSVSLTFLLMILAVGEVPCPAQEQVRNFTVHTGSLNLDFTVGRSFGTVASAQTDPLEFGTDSAISGPGGITAGAAMGVSISPWLLFMAEASYVAGGCRQYDFGAGFTGDSLTSAWVYEAGVHFRYRATENGRFVPYFAGGLSTIQVRANLLVNFLPPDPPSPGMLVGGATDLRLKQATFAPLAGVGFRYYITRSFGIRSELKGYFPTGEVRAPFGRIVGGVFFQLR